jgi:hypothetical protein
LTQTAKRLVDPMLPASWPGQPTLRSGSVRLVEKQLDFASVAPPDQAAGWLVLLVVLVYLVCLVYLVDLVHLISFIQPNKQDKPNNALLTLATVAQDSHMLQPVVQ